MKKIIITLIASIGFVYADPFPLASSQQPVPAPQLSQVAPTIVSQQPTPIPTKDPVNSGKVLVNNQNSGTSKMVSNSDNLTNDLNNLKKQQAIQNLQSDMSKKGQVPVLTTGVDGSTVPVVVEKPISAAMIGYIVLGNGVSIATIQFADNSTIEVQNGSFVSGYKVVKINPDYIKLSKYDKSVTGDKNITLRKSNPITNNSQQANGGASFGSYQTMNMDIPKKAY